MSLYRDSELYSGKVKSTMSRRSIFIYRFVIVSMVVLCIASGGVCAVAAAYATVTVAYNIAAALFGMLLSAILFGCCFLGNHFNTLQDRLFSAMVGGIFLEFVLVTAQISLIGSTGNIFWLYVFEAAQTVVAMAIHLLFWYYQSSRFQVDELRNIISIWVWLLSGIYLICLILNFWTGFLFGKADGNTIAYTKDGMRFLITWNLLYYIPYFIYIFTSRCALKRKFFYTIHIALPLVFWAFIDLVLPNSLNMAFIPTMYLVMILTAYLIFLNVYLDDKEELLYRRMESMEKEKILAEMEREQSELQTSIMMSQIGPHFLYNSLASIGGLCIEENAYRTQMAINTFASYMRDNLDFIKQSPYISFEKEMQHVESYLWLEKLRFDDDLKIEYDIGISDFMLPSFCVQPLVENAVSHGVMKKRGGGTVRIESEKVGDQIRVTVSDDGVGFDPAVKPDDCRTHTGIDGVRKRLDALCGGRMVIQSMIGVGTTITLWIPSELSQTKEVEENEYFGG